MFPSGDIGYRHPRFYCSMSQPLLLFVREATPLTRPSERVKALVWIINKWCHLSDMHKSIQCTYRRKVVFISKDIWSKLMMKS